jgi:hypothetical protein
MGFGIPPMRIVVFRKGKLLGTGVGGPGNECKVG